MTDNAKPPFNALPTGGYWVDETGERSTLPWPSDPDEKRYLIRNSLGPLVINWAEGRLSDEEFEQYGPGLLNPSTGGSWEFPDAHKRELILYYAYNPETGEFLYARDPKPCTPAMGIIEQLGPTLLAWTEQGWTAAKVVSHAR